MTTTVIVTCEAAGTNADGGERRRLLQINVGSLLDIEIAIPHGFEGFADVPQVVRVGHPIWIPLSARSFAADASIVVRVFIVDLKHQSMVGRQHWREVDRAWVVFSKGDVLEPRARQRVWFVVVIQQIGVCASG